MADDGNSQNDRPPWRQDPEAPDSKPFNHCEVVNDIRQDCDMGVWDTALYHADNAHANRLEIHKISFPAAYPVSLTSYPDPSEVFADGANWGLTWLKAIIGMFEAIRAYHVTGCVVCDYDGREAHPDPYYDETLYLCTDGLTYCGSCADELDKEDAKR